MEICLKLKIIFKKAKKIRLFLTYINIKCKKQGIMENGFNNRSVKTRYRKP